MILLETGKEKLVFKVGEGEKSLLATILQLYPRATSSRVLSSGPSRPQTPIQQETQALLEDSLQEQRNENKKLVKTFLAKHERFQKMDAAWNFCPASMYPECTLMTGDHKGIAIAADGNVWMGADFAAERLSYMDQSGGNLYAWVDNDVDVPKADGLRLWVNRSNDSQHREWGGRDFVTGMAFDVWGDLWVSSYMNGVARVPMKGSFSTATSWSASSNH